MSDEDFSLQLNHHNKPGKRITFKYHLEGKTMKLIKIIITISLLITMFYHASSADEIGLSLGTNMMLFDESGSTEGQSIDKFTSWDYTPLNLMLSYRKSFKDIFTIGLTTGYGYKSTEREVDHSNNATSERSTITSQGIPVELELLAGRYVDSSESVKLFIGSGLGYYNYETVLTHQIKPNGGSFTTTSEHSSRYNGKSLYLTGGFTMQISQKLDLSLQLRKMLISAIKIEEEDMLVPSTITSTYSSANLPEIGIALGINYKL